MKNIKEPLLILLVVVSLVASIGLFNLKEKQKGLKNEAAAKLNILRNTLTKLGDDVTDKEKTKAQFGQRLDDLTRQTSSLEVQIKQLRDIASDSQRQLASIEQDIASSQDEKRNFQNEKNQLMETISRSESEMARLQDELDILKQTTAALERHLKKIARADKAQKAQVLEAQPGMQEAEPNVSNTPSLAGEVLVVNREFNFIVVNLGKQNGLKEGDALKVYDGEKLLGTAHVETVRENISAASGGKMLDAYRLKPGNKVYTGANQEA